MIENPWIMRKNPMQGNDTTELNGSIQKHWPHMSEYQLIRFRAVDRPLTDKQLDFMDRQSSRAEFTKWDYEVDYYYSSFRGDVDGMLRHGYDIFLTYSNYGNCEIRLRLPSGLPFPEHCWRDYVGRGGLKYVRDQKGTGGILSIAPLFEEADGEDWDFEEYLEAAAELRELLIAGDLRSLYLLWLCSVMDVNVEATEDMEPPVPHGLAGLPDGPKYLLAFFNVDPLLVNAAAAGIPAFDSQKSQADLAQNWIRSLTASRKTEIIQRLVSEDPVALKSELLTEQRDGRNTAPWPVEPPGRTIANLLETCGLLRQKQYEKEQLALAAQAKREAIKAEKLRQKRMAEMKSAPAPWLVKASQLVDARGSDNYREAAGILADLRDAVGGDEGSRIAHNHAARLAKKHPTLSLLKSFLRKSNLLD